MKYFLSFCLFVAAVILVLYFKYGESNEKVNEKIKFTLLDFSDAILIDSEQGEFDLIDKEGLRNYLKSIVGYSFSEVYFVVLEQKSLVLIVDNKKYDFMFAVSPDHYGHILSSNKMGVWQIEEGKIESFFNILPKNKIESIKD